VTNEGRRREQWSDREWVLLHELDARNVIVDQWPNGRLCRSCRVCASPFIPARKNGRGPWPKECSDSCRRIYRAWNSERYRQGHHRVPM